MCFTFHIVRMLVMVAFKEKKMADYFEAYTKKCPHCGSTDFVGITGSHFFKNRNFHCNHCNKGFEKPEDVPNVTNGTIINYNTNAKNREKTNPGKNSKIAKKMFKKLW